MSDVLHCRAQVHPACYNGRVDADEVVYGGDPWRTDGTYLPQSDSVVCDACYLALGQPLNGPELEGAILKAQARERHA